MEKAEEKAAAGVVVGMHELTGEVRPRVDIDVMLVEQEDTFNLFLQALAELQKDPKFLGYYALAGIHGLPSEDWDGVDKRFHDDFGGYCAHSVLVFATWHRPYLALVEQTIYLQMIKKAKEYASPHREMYLKAAKAFRLPYFDYFRPRDGEVKFPGIMYDRDTGRPSGKEGPEKKFPYNFRLPDIFNAQKVALRLPPYNTLEYDIDNPLYTYKFTEETGQLPLKDQARIRSVHSTAQTVRWPDSTKSTTHNLQKLSNSLNSNREAMSSLALSLIHSTPYEELSAVASDRVEKGDTVLKAGDFTEFPDGLGASGSLEGLHNTYHLLIGGDNGNKNNRSLGHMRNPSVAAFDPVFWFHHCQIDRIWAFWQAFHPNAWFPQPQKEGELAENKKDLLPFYKSLDKTTFHNSDDTKTTEFYGYVYDDFVGINGDLPKLRKNLDEKYLWATRTPIYPNITDIPNNMKPLTEKIQKTHFFKKAPKSGAQVFARASAPTIPLTNQAVLESRIEKVTKDVGDIIMTPLIPTKINPKFDREWYIDSMVKRSAANGTFTIYFFLVLSGELTTDPTQYSQSPYLAGLSHIFAAPSDICTNCGDLEAAGQIVSDTSPITPLLLDYLDEPDNGLESMRPEHVKPFLVKYLRWRVVYQSDGEQDPRNVPNLHIGVSAKVYHDNGTRTYETYPDVVADIGRNASPTASA